MLSRFFNPSLPKPDESLLEKHLKCFQVRLDSQLISAAYEPRFELFALGSATGYLYIVNNIFQIMSSPKSLNYPILKIIPLLNTSSFLSFCSKTMFERHPSHNESRKMDITSIDDIKSSKVQNIITQWIIKPDAILSRTINIDFDLIDAAVSPTQPQFALLLTKEGSIFGFSVETMSLTNLYINVFEKLPVTSIFCQGGFKYYITHDKIEVLDIQNMEMDTFANHPSLSFDCIDKNAAIIDKNGTPKLLVLSNALSSFDVPENSHAIFCGMISGTDWITIIRSDKGDMVFENKRLRLELENEFLIPNVIIRYKKPFARSNVDGIFVITDHGKIININGDENNCFFEEQNGIKKTLIDHQTLYAFSDDSIIIFTNNVFSKIIPNEIGIPLAVEKGKFLIAEHIKEEAVQDTKQTKKEKSDDDKSENESDKSKKEENEENTEQEDNNKQTNLYVVDASELFNVNYNDKKKKPIQKELLATIKPLNIISTRTRIDFICEDMKVFRCELKTKNIFEFHEVEEKPSGDHIKDWRKFGNSYIIITNDNHMIYNDFDKKLCKNDDKLLLFEIVDQKGKPTSNSDGFVLVVTTEKIRLYQEDEKDKFHKVRKSKKEILDATLAYWGALILHTNHSLLMLPLPDFNYDEIDKIHFSKNESVSLIPYHGALIFQPFSYSIYLKIMENPEIYNPEKPPLEIPQVNAFLKLFGKKDETLNDADKAFQYSGSRGAIGNLEETNEIMQRLLVKAQERSEMLNEMEIKSQQLMQSAQKFHELAKSLRKQFL